MVRGCQSYPVVWKWWNKEFGKVDKEVAWILFPFPIEQKEGEGRTVGG